MNDHENLEAIINRFHAAMDAQDFDEVLELVAPDVRVRVGGHDLDRDAWLGMGQMFTSAFTDSSHEIEEAIVAGDQIITRTVWRGTHSADFQGIPATGRRIALNEIVVNRFVDGRITEHFAQFDSLGLMQQLGAIPGAPA